MLHWFITDSVSVSEVLAQKRLIQLEEVIADVENISIKCIDENVSLARVRKYFKRNAWDFIMKLVESVRENSKWYCAVCCNELDSGESIGCDACLDWYHLKCSGLSRKPKKKIWICRNCHKT